MSQDSATVSISKFIDATAELMEALQHDVRNDGIISNDTMEAFMHLTNCMEKIAAVLDSIKSNNSQLN